ncbi:hypothetical protein ACFXPY_46960 [Streptomyces sp. NPDC059153]|uniref:hypothetical protein n=1 Tax=Streptomyces sp. NPDC059153 TaxID=3346743 RepID=UPI0036C97F2D
MSRPEQTGAIALWRDRRFCRFWAPQPVSQFGDRITELALPLIAVSALNASANQVAWLTVLIWTPNLLAIFLGAWVDHQAHKRRLVILADLVRAAVLLGLPAAHLSGTVTLGQLYAVATVNFFTFAAGSGLIALFASRSLELSAGVIGIAFGIGATGSLLGAVFAPKISRRFGVGRSIILARCCFRHRSPSPQLRTARSGSAPEPWPRPSSSQASASYCSTSTSTPSRPRCSLMACAVVWPARTARSITAYVLSVPSSAGYSLPSSD